jgi:hypothetical protein
MSDIGDPVGHPGSLGVCLVALGFAVSSRFAEETSPMREMPSILEVVAEQELNAARFLEDSCAPLTVIARQDRQLPRRAVLSTRSPLSSKALAQAPRLGLQAAFHPIW